MTLLSDEGPEEQSYVGIAPCGCVRAACVDTESRKRDTAQFCARLIRDGLKVERWQTEAVRKAKWGCEKCDPRLAEMLQGKLL